MFQEREEALLKQQKENAGDVLDLSSLTLEEPSSPVEEVVTNTSSTKVGRRRRSFHLHVLLSFDVVLRVCL